MNSGSSNEDRLEDTRTNPVENRMLAGNRLTLDEPAGYGQETKSTEEEEEEEEKKRNIWMPANICFSFNCAMVGLDVSVDFDDHNNTPRYLLLLHIQYGVIYLSICIYFPWGKPIAFCTLFSYVIVCVVCVDYKL